MKTKLAILALALVCLCLWGSPAKADTVYDYSSGIFTGWVEFAPGRFIPVDYSITWGGVPLHQQTPRPPFPSWISSLAATRSRIGNLNIPTDRWPSGRSIGPP
jgi:hypothetical protein